MRIAENVGNRKLFFRRGWGRIISQTYEEPNPNEYKNVSFIEIEQLEAGQKSERHVEAILKKT